MSQSRIFSIFDKLIILLLFVVTIPLLYLSFYNEPSADDYTYAIKLCKNSFFYTQYYEYMHWGSRYIATAILIADPIHWGSFFGYRMISALMIVLFICASYFMFYQQVKNKILSIKLASVLSFVYIFQLPEINSAFYWLSGAATYHLSNILFVLYIGFSAKISKKKKLGNLILFLLIFLIVGCNEISMIYLLLYNFLLLTYNFSKTRNFFTLYFYLFVWTGLLTIFILIAPGNYERSHSVINPYSFSEIIFRSLKKTIVIIFRYSFLSFLIIFLAFYNLRKPLQKMRFTWLSLPYYFYTPLFLIVIFIGCFPSIYTLGTYPPLRTVNVIFLMILILLMIFCHKLINRSFINKIHLPQFLINISLLILVLGYTFAIRDSEDYDFSNNIYYSYDDIVSGKAKKYKEEVHKRYEIIQKSKEDTVYLSPIQTKPRIIYHSDLSHDPKHFYNASMAEYFNKKAIIIK
ncbi:hypothetical protein Ga0061079_10452 [Apibacter mensalis]|uniref:Dolichyl-phosphate-mannose-protein mannosyltransferase n=1 Tax=Apibacter mensalis TaxID=1586267 RepID=A0A0X3ANJ2_9FLAO|nr:DUF6056 family protein [Apibacter mensalis]CVK15934.1 hypothetical protein Ga0061079_10452 [Apibacter mensalis]